MMYNRIIQVVLMLMLVIFGLAGTLQAGLTSNMVLVVANQADTDSIALAKYYIKMRNIPAKNLILIKTGKGYEISREDYNNEIRSPLIKVLNTPAFKQSIQCICIIRGVPVRIKSPKALAKNLEQTYEIISINILQRILRSTQLTATVGVKYPSKIPTDKSDSPIEKFFDPQKRIPPPHRRDAERIVANFQTQIKLAESRTKTIPRQKQIIALAQLRAIYRETMGMKGLISFCKRFPHDSIGDLKSYAKQLISTENELTKLTCNATNPSGIISLLSTMENAVGVIGVHKYIQTTIGDSADELTDASVDSELALLRAGKYDLNKWQANSLFWQARDGALPAIMVSRLDGPSQAVVMRMIKDSIQVENAGLDGRIYIDAGGPARAKQYDKHFIDLATFITNNSKLKLRLDREISLFKPNSCPDASLYVGWYSKANYVNSFLWNKGAIAWHVAGAEAINLRNPAARQWCPQMLLNGVAATIGAVNEPYLSAFPLPENFFPLLLTGKYTLAECYWRCVEHTSWRMILLGDPLYNPFKANAQITPASLPRGLAK